MASILRLIRWPNLLFILITQCLFYFVFVRAGYTAGGLAAVDIHLGFQPFLLLCSASVLIAAGGYIINDYYDVAIDLINKPHAVIVSRTISRRAAFALYAGFSIVGIVVSGWAALLLQNAWILVCNFAAVLLLLLYSTTLKRKLLIGNILISLLTAWVIFVLVIAAYRHDNVYLPSWNFLIRCAAVYGVFAWLISLIREVVKDMEDVAGDKKLGCTTMPVVWGMAVSRRFAGFMMLLLAGLVSILMFFLFEADYVSAGIYSFFFITFPLIISVRKLYAAKEPHDFHKLSALIKGIMMTGILSMLFFLTI